MTMDSKGIAMTRPRARIETHKKTWRSQIAAARTARLAGDPLRFHHFMGMAHDTHQRVLWELIVAYIREA